MSMPTGPLGDRVSRGGHAAHRSGRRSSSRAICGAWSVRRLDPRRPLPADTEERLASFTELVATAMANAESRAALAASRARIVAAADESSAADRARSARRGAAAARARGDRAEARAAGAVERRAEAGELVAEALRHAEQANSELRELAHGILPAALTREGLRAGVEALVSRMSLPVSVDVAVERLPAGVEATAYFVVSEALTNVVKHARAARAAVTARVERGELRVEVRDDGVGRRARAGRHRLGRTRRSRVGAGRATCGGEPSRAGHACVCRAAACWPGLTAG